MTPPDGLSNGSAEIERAALQARRVESPLRFAYADPPYLGCGRLYAAHHPDARAWDDLATHAALIERLGRDYPNGWALSASVPSLRHLLPLLSERVRIAAWVKPFAVFKPGVNPAYAWEPVLFSGGRKRSREEPTARDWHSANITLKKGCPGAKPVSFVRWVLLDLLGARPGLDTVDDLFPGTGIVEQTWAQLVAPDIGDCPSCGMPGPDGARCAGCARSNLGKPDPVL